MKNKYYTPTIDEFHVGFEFEYNTMSECGSSTKYVKNVFKSTDNVDNLFKDLPNDWYDLPRVKYLDKKDIESLGFTNKNHKEIPSKFSYYKIIDDSNIYKIQVYWDMLLEERENLIRIYKGRFHKYPYREIFRGDIKNKSELKRLLKQLNIL